MDIALLEAKAIARRLPALIEKHEQISIAVAWGELTGVAEKLLANTAKFQSVLLGVDFSATDPDLIDRLVDVPNAFVAKSRPGCFHPKIFYFQSGPKAEAIVGSANFTKGGLGVNFEASIHVKGAADDGFFEQVLAIGDQPGDETYPKRFGGVDAIARQEQIERATVADEALQTLRAASAGN